MTDRLDLIRPGTLRTRLKAAEAHALASGALRSLPARHHWVPDGEVSFLVRQLEILAHKPDGMQGAGTAPNPFLPYDRDLFVGDFSSTHVGLLNKFNVVEQHLLVVTRTFASQTTALNRRDFEALAFCLGEFPGLAFFNGGREAGASQLHKHLQYIPLPIAPDGIDLPIAPWLGGDTGSLPAGGPPWRHALARFSGYRRSALQGGALWESYRELVTSLDLADGQQMKPYNLLMTRDWMMLIPRRKEAVAGIAVNALGFAGTLLVKDLEQLQQLKGRGPVALLCEAGYPA